MKVTKLIASLLAAACLLPAGTAIAHEDGGHLARMWQFTPKENAGAAMAEAFSKHVAWRKANNDPWGWDVYYARTGKNVGAIYVRSFGHHWKDFDDYSGSEFSKKASEHWNSTVHPHVAAYDTWIDKSDDELFYWPEDSNFSHFWVTTFHLKPGHSMAARAAVKAVHTELKAAGRNSPHVWLSNRTGKHLPSLVVVTARNDWAGFDWPEKSVYETMVERVGEEKTMAMFADFFEHVSSQQSVIYERDLDLSFDAAE